MRYQPRDAGPSVADSKILLSMLKSRLCSVWNKTCTCFARDGRHKKQLGHIKAVPLQWSGTNGLLQTPSRCNIHKTVRMQGVDKGSKVFLSLVLKRTFFVNLFLNVWTPCYAWQYEISVSWNHTRTRLAWQACSTSFTYESMLLQYKHEWCIPHCPPIYTHYLTCRHPKLIKQINPIEIIVSQAN